MEIITKRAFAKRCGVSMPTVYKWIDKDKDGLRAFVHDDGIDAAVFDAASWSAYKSAKAIENEQNAQRVQELQDELQKAKGEAAAQIEQQQEIIRQQSEIINLLRDQIASKDQQIQQLHVLMRQQLQALPQPKQKRTFLEWLGIKKPAQEQTTEN